MRMSISKQLGLFSVGSILMLALLGAVSFYKASQLLGHLDDVSSNQLPAVRNMSLADMMHDGLRGLAYYSIVAAETKDGSFNLQEVEKERVEMIAQFRMHIAELEKLTLKPETQRAIDAAKPDLDAYIETTSQLVTYAVQGKPQQARAMTARFETSFHNLEKKLEVLGDLIEQDAMHINKQGKDSLYWSAGFTLIGILAGAIFAYFIISRLTRHLTDAVDRIQEAGERVGVASAQLSESSESLSSASISSASSLEETVASLETLSGMVSHNNSHAKEACDLSFKSKTAAEEGESEIKNLIGAMSEIADSSKKMEDIINVIDDIAFQTNLLALNAAVEAARAGDQGKGFAVVAEAVRSLAQRSAAAAKDIKSMIQESVRKIEGGGKIADRSGMVLGNIVTAVNRASTLNSEISTASAEQAAGISQISKAMNQLDRAAQSNAASAEEVAASSGEMSNQANTLREIVGELRALISGERDGSSPGHLKKTHPDSHDDQMRMAS